MTWRLALDWNEIEIGMRLRLEVQNQFSLPATDLGGDFGSVWEKVGSQWSECQNRFSPQPTDLSTDSGSVRKEVRGTTFFVWKSRGVDLPKVPDRRRPPADRPDMSDFGLLVKFCTFWDQNLFFNEISRWFCMALPGEAQFFPVKTSKFDEKSKNHLERLKNT